MAAEAEVMILGKRVRLRPLGRADLPRFVQWIADPEVRACLALYRPLSLEQEESWYERNLEAGDTQSWAIDALHAESSAPLWEHIGVCGYHAIDWRNRSGEVGIIVGAREYWGRGFGTDAMQTLVNWGFKTLNLNRVHLHVYADNLRAIRSYEKVGFRTEGRMRQANFYNGAYRDAVVMGVLREEWHTTLNEAAEFPL